MARPLIGLTGGRVHGRDIARNLDVLGDSPVDVFYADYSQAVIAAGGIPVFLPVDLAPVDVIDELDGLLLTGGDDISPDRYGAAIEANTHPPDPTRDAYEFAMLDHAVERSLPTLGICRGLQLVNVHAGGTLHQHVPAHAFIDEPGSVEQHVVSIEPASVLAGIYGTSHPVNSLHHQSVDQLGANLRVTASTDDCGVEAIEHADLPIVAVQWHPEMLATAATDPIFVWLVSQALTKRTSVQDQVMHRGCDQGKRS